MAFTERITGNKTINVFATANNTPPEMQLWASILELAINDYVTGKISGSFNEDYRSAEEWIFHGDTRNISNFETVCAIFNMDPVNVRKAIETDPINIKQRLISKVKKRDLSCTTTQPSTTTSD